MKELKATKGNYLTQIDDVGNERIYVTALKGASLDESQWREATKEEKDAFDKEQEELRKENNNQYLIK